jgi:hypothetical protein
MHLQRGRQTKIERELIEQLLPLTARHRTITPADRKARWREQYLAAAEINFAQCVGQKPGTNEAHWVELTALGWAKQHGVPAALVQQWERERRRT